MSRATGLQPGGFTVHSADGTAIDVQACGEGRPVVFVHGLQLTAAVWADPAAALPDHWRRIAPDLRGRGLSGRPGGIDDYRIERLVDDLEAVSRTLQQPFAVVGWSMGATVAWAFSRRPAASRVERWVFVSGSPDAASTRRLFVDGDLDSLMAQASERTARNPAVAHCTPFAAVASWLDFRERDFLATPPPLRAPALFIHGDADEECPIGPVRELASRLGARLEVFAGAGHNPMRHDPTRFAQVLTAFIDGG